MKNVLLFLNLLIGIGACGGGVMAFLSVHSMETAESFGLSKEMLLNSPFQSFLIPGIFLLVVIGFGNLISGWLLYRKKDYFAEAMMGLILIAWILIQVYMLMAIVFLHVLFFLLGVVQLTLSVYSIKKLQLKLPFSAQQN
jgi:hypothetical protein